MLNTDASGKGSAFYGKTSDHILELITILGNGESITIQKTKQKRFKVVVDAVNSSGGIALPKILEAFGVEIVKINCEPDGNFPHNPEPLEENLKDLADHLDSKYNKLKKDLGNIGESKLMLITAIKMVDEYFDLNKKVNSKKNEFEKLSIKFKELRSLAINYKEEKEKEIEKLKSELNKFETLIEESRSSYEEILDKTTKSIEKFIENTETDQEKNVQ